MLGGWCLRARRLGELANYSGVSWKDSESGDCMTCELANYGGVPWQVSAEYSMSWPIVEYLGSS